jgi:hypothetical protein
MIILPVACLRPGAPHTHPSTSKHAIPHSAATERISTPIEMCCGGKTADATAQQIKFENMGMIKDADRKCTDLFCLILFLIFFAGFVGIGIFGLISGEPLRFGACWGVWRARMCGGGG